MRVLAIISILFPVSLLAKPMYIDFFDMMEQSKTIVIGEFLGPKNQVEDSLKWSYPGPYLIKVNSRLKGTASDTIEVGRAHGTVYLPESQEFICFINQENEFEWYGGQINEEGRIIQLSEEDNPVVQIEGFYDFNAYLVGPAVFTLKQLKYCIKHGQIQMTIHGKIHFYDPVTNDMEPSDMELTTDIFMAKDTSYTETHDYNFPETELVGAKSRIGSWDPVHYVSFEENLVRPFTLEGEIMYAREDGSMEAMYWVEAPEELSEAEFKDYLSDEINGPPLYIIEIKSEEGEKMTLERQASPPSSTLVCENGRISFSSSNDPDKHEGGYIEWDNGWKMKFDHKYASIMKEYTRQRLVRTLRKTDVSGTLLRGDADSVAITLHLKETSFPVNPNYRK